MKAIETIHKGLHRSSALGWSITTLICWITPSFAAEIHVPQDAPTIQAGIDLALSGDTVVVSCGTYSEALLLKSGVTLRSETGSPDCVTLDVAAGTAAMTADGDDDVVIEGIRVSSSASPSRGLVAWGSSVALRSCEFLNLRTQGAGLLEWGGPAILIEHQSEMDIDDCFLADNSHSGIGGHGGGAVACDSSTVTIDSSTLVRNSSTSSGGAVSTRLSVVTIVGSMFGENQANVGGSDPFGGAGGAIFSDGLLSPLALTDCVFDRNSAGVGGAVAFGVLDMQGCQVLNNEAVDGGGVWGINGTITDSWFSRNRADHGTAMHASGGMFAQGTVFERNGCRGTLCEGTLFSLAGINFLNCTFAQNQVVGDPATNAEISIHSGNSILILNTIIAFSDGGRAVNSSSGTVNAQCSDFIGNSGGDWVGDVQGQNGVAGNISADPLFCGLAAFDYSLQSNSPCSPSISPCGLIGALGVKCGPVSIDEMSWGSIMALYR